MKKILLLLLTFAVISCNKTPDFTKIKVGMKTAEVVELVGKPKEKQDNPLFGTWYVYEKNIIVFRNDTVVKTQNTEELQEKLKGINKGLEDLKQSVNKLKKTE